MSCAKGTGREHPSSHGTLSVASEMQAPAIRLAGEMQDVIYDLTVTQAWTNREGLGRHQRPGDVVSEGPFAPVTAKDHIGFIPHENWTVNMFWPRTNVNGTFKDKTTNETFLISAHGYRENSFGRWNFVSGGWDFAIMSDTTKGVQWNWQSYFRWPGQSTGESKDGTTLDLSFVDPDTNKLEAVRFSGGELGWAHPIWKYRMDSRQCTPANVVVIAANDDLVVTMNITINDSVPLLSDATFLTKVYAIEEWFPFFEGTIRRQGRKEPLINFSGIGGGEIAMVRDTILHEHKYRCEKAYRPHYRQQLNHPILSPSEDIINFVGDEIVVLGKSAQESSEQRTGGVAYSLEKMSTRSYVVV